MTNRKSHTPFRLVSKSTTLDDFERPMRTLFAEKMSFGAHHKNLNEDKPILSVAKCRPVTLVSGAIRFMRIFAEVPRGEASNDSGIVENGNFQSFRCLFFGNFRDEASVII